MLHSIPQCMILEFPGIISQQKCIDIVQAILGIAEQNSMEEKFCMCVKAVQYWSCPLNRSRDRIITHRPRMPKWVQTCEKILCQMGLERTPSSLALPAEPQLLMIPCVYLRNLTEMRLCGSQPIKILYCQLH